MTFRIESVRQQGLTPKTAVFGLANQFEILFYKETPKVFLLLSSLSESAHKHIFAKELQILSQHPQKIPPHNFPHPLFRVALFEKELRDLWKVGYSADFSWEIVYSRSVQVAPDS